MPRFFDFMCLNEKCGHRFEASVNTGDRVEAKCPKCGSYGKRLYTSFGIQFKGSGFHVNDYPNH